MKEKFKIISIAVIALVGVSLAQAQWAGPDVPPPGGSVPSPIYTNGPAEQTKLGILNLEGGLNVIGTGVTTDSLVVAGEPSDGPNEIRGRLSTAGGLILEKRFPAQGAPLENGRFWVEGTHVNDGNPATIASCEELQQAIFESNTTYRLMNNIDCSSTNPTNGGYSGSIWDGDANHNGFRPLTMTGNSIVFDGQGYEIQNLYIEPKNGLLKAGLFADINTSSSIVRNLSIVNFSIDTDSTAGALAASVNNTGFALNIDNVYVQGSISGGFSGGLVAILDSAVISNVVANVNIDADNTAGGIVGRADGGSIEDSITYGNVTGLHTAGGLVGISTRASIERSVSYGDVDVSVGDGAVGGLVGWLESSPVGIRDSAAYGNVTGGVSPQDFTINPPRLNTLYSDAGNLVGTVNASGISDSMAFGQVEDFDGEDNGGLVGSERNAVCQDNFWNSETSGISTGLCASSKTATEMLDVSTYTNAGWNFTFTWKQVSPNHYPCLQWMDDSMCVEAN